MEQHFAAGVRPDADLAREHDGPPREDFVAPGEHDSFAIAVDPRGRLLWESGDLDGDHLVAVLTERVPDDYLAGLRDRGVSYVLAGRADVDLGVSARPRAAHGVTDRGADCARPGVGHRAGRPA